MTPPNQRRWKRREPCARANACVSARETDQHRELKRLALLWLQSCGYVIAATEVSLPNARCRFDLAGYRPLRATRGISEARLGQTAILECKQSRADFLRDACDRAAALAQLAKLHERKARLEAHLQVHCPWLGNGDSLFSEYVSYDFERLGHEHYRKTITRIRQLSQRVHAQTKFDDIRRWDCANLYYAVTMPGVARPHELPFGWGLLLLKGDHLCLEQKPAWHEVSAQRRLALLQRIAAAATREVNKAAGVTWEMIATYSRAHLAGTAPPH